MSFNKLLLKKISMILAAGLTAFLILTVFCYFYYNIPARNICPDSATDYRWEPHSFYSRATESLAYGVTNNEGYNNRFDYEEGMPIDILVVGSSHMEAYQVQQDQNTASQLGSLLPGQTIYNIGVSSHNFLTCAANLEAALRKYQPSRFAILETASVIFSDADLLSVLEGSFPEQPANAGGLAGILQRNPFLRLMNTQFKNASGNIASNDEDAPTVSRKNQNDEALLDALLCRLGETAANAGTQLIIFYHPTLSLNADAELVFCDDDPAVAQFDSICGKHGIIFIDMTERIEQEYLKNHILPYGFCNTSVGKGHLNRHGHAMIAEELCQRMEAY